MELMQKSLILCDFQVHQLKAFKMAILPKNQKIGYFEQITLKKKPIEGRTEPLSLLLVLYHPPEFKLFLELIKSLKNK